MRSGLYALHAGNLSSVVNTTINAEAEWLMTLVNYDGALRETPGDTNVRPYMSHYGCIGLARAYESTGKHAYLDAAWNWLSWYAARMNPTTGYVNDYTTSDGGVTWTDSGAADSTDAYAGMYLTALWLTYKASNDADRLRALAASIPLAITAITSTQQTDGLTWALPTYHARYLEDNIEALVGLRAAILLATAVGNTAATTSATAAATTMALAIGYLWNPTTTTWDWSVDDYYVHTVNDWSNENSRRQQLWATAWGAWPDTTTAAAVLAAYKTALPGWSTQRSSFEVLPAWAYLRLGDSASAKVGVDNLKASTVATNHAYPWTVATGGQLVVADLGMSSAHKALLPAVTFPTGTNLLPNSTFALDTNSDGTADGVSKYDNNATLKLNPFSAGTGNAQRMTVTAGTNSDMRWAPVSVTARHFYTFSIYRRINALHTGDGQAVLKYELLDANGNNLPGLYGYNTVSATDAVTSATRWSIRLFVPDGATKVRCLVGINNGGTIDVAYPVLEDAGNPTPFSGGKPTFGPANGAVPSAPTNVSATPGTSQVTVTWTASTITGDSPISSYTVTADHGGASVTTANGTTTTATVTGLTNGDTYTFTVAANNASGPSSASEPSAYVTPANLPSAPTGVTSTATATGAVVYWTAPTNNGGATVYQYQVTASPGGAKFISSGANITQLRATGLTAGTPYTFTVQAGNIIGYGTASAATAAVTPKAAHTTASLPFWDTFDALSVGGTPAAPWYSSGIVNGKSIALGVAGTAVASPRYTPRPGYTMLGFYPGYSVGTGSTGEMAGAMTGLDTLFSTWSSRVECISNGWPNQIGDVTTWIQHMQGVKQHAVVSAPLVPMSNGSLTSGLKGTYDSLIRDTFTKCVAAGWNGDRLTIRLGWEWDGTGFSWAIGVNDPNGGGTGIAAKNTPANYRAMFRRYVGIARSCGFTGRFDCNGASPRGTLLSNGTFAAIWPGNDYGDANGGGAQIIGTDPYNSIVNGAFYSLDNTTANPNQANTFSSDPAAVYRYGYKKTDFVGVWANEIKPNLDAIITFAKTNNVLVGFGEMGVIVKHADRFHTNDTGLYFTNMKAWINDPANQPYMIYVCPFNQNQPGSGTVTEDDQLFYTNAVGGTVPTQTWTGDTVPPPGTTISMGTMANTSTTGTTWVDTPSPNHTLSLPDYKAKFRAGTMQNANSRTVGGSNGSELLIDLPSDVFRVEWDWIAGTTPGGNANRLLFRTLSDGPIYGGDSYYSVDYTASTDVASNTVFLRSVDGLYSLDATSLTGAGAARGSSARFKLDLSTATATLTVGTQKLTLNAPVLDSKARTLVWVNDGNTTVDNISIY